MKDLTRVQIALLRQVRDGITHGLALVEASGLSAPTVYSNLKKLAAAGVLEKHEERGHGVRTRRYLYILTERGKKALVLLDKLERNLDT